MFYCGSYSFLKEKLKKQIEKIQKEKVGENLTFIVHTNQMKTYLKEYLTKEVGILVNAKFYTLIDISKELTKIEPLQDFDKELMLKKCLYEKGLKLEGLSEEFSALIQQLKEFEISIDNLKSPLVKEVIYDYEQFLKDNGYFDREDVHKIAVDNSDINFDNLFVFGIKSVPSLHQKLFKKLKSISNNFFVFSPFSFDSGVYENYDHLKEIRKFWENLTGFPVNEKTDDLNLLLGKEIYRFDYDIKELENENIKLVKVRNEYEEVEYVAEKIAELLNRDVKPHKIGIAVPRIEDYLPFLKEIFKKYKIPYYLVEESRFIDEPIFKKLFSIFKIKENNFSKDSILTVLSDELLDVDEIQDLEEKIILEPISEGFEEWEEFVFKKDKDNNLFKLLLSLNSLPDKAKIEEYINKFEEINELFIKDEKAKNFLSNVLNSLKEVELYKKLFNQIEYDEFVSIIETFFKEENKENRIKGDTVFVVTPISAEANNFDYLFFLNLNSGDFPSTLKEEILATSVELNGLNYPYYLLMQQILNFVNLLDKEKKIHLSFTASSVSSAERVPSIIIEEIKRILNKEDIPLIKVSQEETLKDFYIKYAKYIKNVDKNLKEKWKKIQKLEKIKKEDFQFNIDFKEIFPVSATKFTTYAYCPYKFYLEKIIGIEVLEEPDRTQISPQEKGILIHELLEKFYKNFEKNDLEKEIKKIEKRYNEKIIEQLKYILPSYRPFEERKANLLLNRLVEFIRFDVGRLKKEQKKPEILEKSYKNRYFTGKIDRVDKDKAHNFYIYDYKTGKAPQNINEEIKNKYIQLLIYKDFLENEGKKVEEIGIFAINDSSGKYLYPINDKDSLNELKNYLKEILKELESKWFYPKENEFCDWCQFLDICQKDKIKEEV